MHRATPHTGSAPGQYQIAAPGAIIQMSISNMTVLVALARHSRHDLVPLRRAIIVRRYTSLRKASVDSRKSGMGASCRLEWLTHINPSAPLRKTNCRTQGARVLGCDHENTMGYAVLLIYDVNISTFERFGRWFVDDHLVNFIKEVLSGNQTTPSRPVLPRRSPRGWRPVRATP